MEVVSLQLADRKLISALRAPRDRDGFQRLGITFGNGRRPQVPAQSEELLSVKIGAGELDPLDVVIWNLVHRGQLHDGHDAFVYAAVSKWDKTSYQSDDVTKFFESHRPVRLAPSAMYWKLIALIEKT